MKSKKHRAEKAKKALQVRLFVPLLILLFILPVASWMLASKMKSGVGASQFVSCGSPGPWGELEYLRIAIELPDHYVDVDNLDANDWFFPEQSQSQILQFLKQCGLSDAQLREIENSEWETLQEGSRISLSDEVLWGLSTECRSIIYGFLAQFETNVDQHNAFAYRADRLEERLAYSGLTVETIAMFKQLLYPQGALLRFADADIVLRRIKERSERLRFVKTVSRRSSLLIKLNVTPGTDIEELLKYWGTGGRSKDLRPLLESLARIPGGGKIDIAHLLPPFVRRRIYSYPTPNSPVENGHLDCHWTSLNFWNEFPGPAFDSPEATAQAVEADYFCIGNDLSAAQLGDIVFLQNGEGILIHSAVFIADDVVFTKNGAGVNQPWIYMKMEDMLPFYDSPIETPKTVIYRRKTI